MLADKRAARGWLLELTEAKPCSRLHKLTHTSSQMIPEKLSPEEEPMKRVRKMTSCHRRHQRLLHLSQGEEERKGDWYWRVSPAEDGGIPLPTWLNVLGGLLLARHLDPGGCRETPKMCLTLRLLPCCSFIWASMVLPVWPRGYKEWLQSSGEEEGHGAQVVFSSVLQVKRKGSRRARQIFRSPLGRRAGVTSRAFGFFHCGALFEEQGLLNRNRIVWLSGTRMSLRTSS